MAVLEENIYITASGDEWLESELVEQADANDMTLEDIITANDLTLREETEEEEVEEEVVEEEVVEEEGPMLFAPNGDKWAVDEIKSMASDNNMTFKEVIVANDLKLHDQEYYDNVEKKEVAEKESRKQKQKELDEKELEDSFNSINSFEEIYNEKIGDEKGIGTVEAELVPYLEENFEKYGFRFEESGTGDYVTVTSYEKGGKSEEFSVGNYGNVDREGLAEMKTWIKDSISKQKETGKKSQKIEFKDVEKIKDFYQKASEKIESNPNLTNSVKKLAKKKLKDREEFDVESLEKKIKAKKQESFDEREEAMTADIIDLENHSEHDWMVRSGPIKTSSGEVITKDYDDTDWWLGEEKIDDDAAEVLETLKLRYPSYKFESEEFNIGFGNEYTEMTVTAPNGEKIILFGKDRNKVVGAGQPMADKRYVESQKRILGKFINKHGIDESKAKEVDKLVGEIGKDLYNKEAKDGGLMMNKEDLEDLYHQHYNIPVSYHITKVSEKEGDWVDALALEAKKMMPENEFLPELDEQDVLDRYKLLRENYKTVDGNDTRSYDSVYKEAAMQLIDESFKRKKQAIENDIYTNFILKHDEKMEAVLKHYTTTKHDKEFKKLAVRQEILNAQIKDLKNNPSNKIVDNFVKTYENPEAEFEYVEGDKLLKLENGKIVNQQTFDNFLTAQQDINSNYEAINKEQSKVLDNIVTSRIDEDAKWDLLRRDYSIIDKNLASIGTGFATLGMGAYSIIHKVGKYTNPLYWLNQTTGVDATFGTYDLLDDVYKQNAIDFSNWKNDIRDHYMPDISFHNAFDSWQNFGLFSAQEVSTQLPIIATIIASGGTAAPYVLGATSAGTHWMEMDVEDWTDDKPGERSELEKGVKSFAFGTAEAVFEGLTTVSILRSGKKLIMESGKKGLLGFRQGVKRYFKENAAKQFVYDPLKESLGEGGTQITQNIIDGKDLLEGVGHSMFSGWFIGSGMSHTAFYTGLAMNKFSDHKTYERFRNNTIKIDKLKKYRASIMSEANKATVEKKIKKLEDENARELEALEGRMSNKLSTKAYNTFMELTQIQERLRVQAEAAINNPKLDKKFKEELLGDLKEEFDNVQRKRDIMRDPEMFGNEMNALKFSENLEDINEWSEIKQIAIEKVKASKTEGPAYKPTNTEIDAAAYDVFLDRKIDENIDRANRNTSKKTDIIGLQTKQDGVNFMENIKDDLLADGMTEADYFDIIQGIKDGTSNGLNFEGTKTGKMLNIVFKDNAIGNERMDISTHEPGHAVFREIFGDKNVDWDGVASQIVLHLEKTNPKLLARMQFRGDARRGSEEFVSEFMEEVARDTKGERIKLNKKENKQFVNILGFMINNSLKEAGKDYTVDFKSETEIVNFVIGLGKSISQGTLTEADVAAAKESVVAKKVSKVKKDTKPADKKKPRESKTKQSKTPQKYSEKEVNKFTKTKDGEPMTQIEWLEFTGKTNERGDVFVNQQKIGKAFDDYIFKKIKGDKNQPGWIFGESTKADIIEDFKDKLRKRGFYDSKIEQFNPEINNNFSGYMASIINNVYKDILAANTKKIKTTPIEQKVGGEGSKVTVGERLVSQEMSPEDATDISLAQDMLKKIKPQTSKIAKKLGLTPAQENLVKRDIINYLRSPKRPSMTNPKKFFKGFVDHMSATTGARLYGKIPNKKGMKAFVGKFADDLIALNKVDPAVMRRSNWDIFYEMEIKQMNPTQTQKAIDEGRVPEKTSLTAGNTLWKTLNPTPTEVVDYLMNIRQDQIKEKLPKFFAEVLGKNEFNEIVDNPIQPVYTPEGKVKKGEKIDLKESITTEEAKVGKPKVKDIIARPGGVKFSEALKSNKNIAEKALEQTWPSLLEKDLNEILTEDINDWKKLPTKYKDSNGEPLSAVNLKDPKQLQEYKDEILDTWPQHFPKEVLKGGFFAGGIKTFEAGALAWKSSPDFQSDLAKAEKKFNTILKKVKKSGYDSLSETELKVFGKDKNRTSFFAESDIDITNATKKISADKAKDRLGTVKFTKENDSKIAGLKKIFQGFARMVENDPTSIKYIAKMLSSTSRNMSQLMRVVSPHRFRELNLEGKATREEHTLPVSWFGRYLLDAAIQGESALDNIWYGVEQNFFQGVIAEVNDDKLKDLPWLPKRKLTGLPPKEFAYDITMGIKSIWLRYFNDFVNNNDNGFNANEILLENGKTLAQEFNVEVKQEFQNDPNVIQIQNELIYQQLLGNEVNAKKELEAFLEIAPPKKISRIKNTKTIGDSKVKSKTSFSKSPSNETIRELGILDKALQIARDPNAPVKKIRVFDFDDTLARTKSNVLYTMPNGKTGKITPAEFAKRGTEMEAEGAVWDFSEFNKVVDGKKGPLLEVAKKIQAARGTEDVFVLTARPQEAAGPIKQFLESIGLNIPINNITGLADSSPLAKSGWIVDKAAEGYNDFYFADDHMANVEAVKLALDRLDVKGKVQQAKVKFSKNLKGDLEQNPNYNKFRNRMANEKLFHGGSITLGDFNAVWFVTGDVKGAWNYALEEDERVYSVEAKDLKDAIIIPDINDTAGFLEIVKEKFPDQVDAIQGRTYISNKKIDNVDIKRVLKQPNASEILNEYMDWVQDNFAMKQSINWKANEINSLYDGKGITQGLPVIVVNRPSNWESNPKLITEVKMSDVYREEKVQEKKAARKESWNQFKSKLRFSKGPVKKVLDVVDVKGKVQQAKIKFSKTIDEKFNEIIQDKTNIKAFKEFSSAQARLRGKNKGRFKFFVPPSADDFVGLLYHLLGKGKKGDAQMAWFKKNLLDPYARAMADITRDRVQMMGDFKALKKTLKNIPKNLRKEAFEGYTYENVARIYAWNKQGSNIPGLSKADLAKVEAFVAKNPEIQVFADQLIDITKGSGYSIPTDSWLSGTITTDLISVLNDNKRKTYLKQWQDNIDLIFSEKNLNKLEAAFGSNYREALENMITRMKSGNNKTTRGSDRLANRFLDYVNNSVGTVMFFNMRSAVLQLISSVNFINWGDNNIIAAGKAFANQKQYWKDFMHLMNSDFLVDRRNGLKINVSESEIADAAATSKNKAKGVIAYILKKGFLPTQFADSFAIASGGASFYRNKVNKYKNEGMSQKEAEAKAFDDFREIAEESQQSSRPDRISQQQASGLGRIILAFANTPMQYTRLIKKASLDLMNGRGDWKSNVSKIVYYAAIQNVIFNALQQAIFAMAWGDDDEEEDEAKKEKMYNVANGMLDSILRGTGIAGGIVSVIKNLGLEVWDRSGRKRPEYADAAYRELDVSPPIDIKVSKLRQAANNYEYNKDLIESKGFAIDNPAWLSLGYVLSSTLNVPLDRLILKMNNVRFALDSDEETWKRVAAFLGWPEWQLRSAKEQEDYKQLRKQEKKEHKNLKKWEVIDGDEIKALKKDQQVNILTEIGLSADEIKDLKYEEDRVNRILEEYEKDEKRVTKILEKNRTTTSTAIKEEEKEKKKEEKKKEEEKKKKEKKERKKILKEDRTTAQDRLYKLRKAEQIDTLISLGLSDSQIAALKYEEDRVREIERLYEENK
jgi:hypothetical protein